MRSANIWNDPSNDGNGEPAFNYFQLAQMIRTQLSQLSNYICVENTDMTEIGFVFTPQSAQTQPAPRNSAFHITFYLLERAIKIIVQPVDVLPQQYKIVSHILPIISEINQIISGNLPNATLVWNGDKTQLSTVTLLTLSHFPINNYSFLIQQLREHIIKELIDKIYLTWKLIEQRTMPDLNYRQNISSKNQVKLIAKDHKNTKPKYYLLDLLKYQFQQNRKSRDLSTGNKIDLNSLRIQSIFNYFSLLQDARKANNLQEVRKQIQVTNKICSKTAKDFYEKYLLNYSQKKHSDGKVKRQKICRGIQFYKTPDRKKLDAQGSFSLTYFLSNCQYGIKFSLFNTTTEQAQQIQGSKLQEEIKCDPLIEKTFTTQDEGSKSSFEIQKSTLFLMRGESCPSIGLYYLKQMNSGLSDVTQIYSQYYKRQSCELVKGEKKQQKVKKLLEFLHSLAEGITFLSDNGILHWDLKPDNIRLDDKSLPKIIDFGSAFPTFGSRLQQKMPNNSGNIARMTRGYFLEYHTLPDYVKTSFFPPEIFEKHQYFDVYAFGIIFSKFFPEGTLTSEMTVSFAQKIKLLINKCLQPNPADRFAPLEIVLYLEILIKIWDKICRS